MDTQLFGVWKVPQNDSDPIEVAIRLMQVDGESALVLLSDTRGSQGWPYGPTGALLWVPLDQVFIR